MPSVPQGEKLDFGSKEFREFEEIGKSFNNHHVHLCSESGYVHHMT